VTLFSIQPLNGHVADAYRARYTGDISVADEDPGYPCRQCLRDAEVDEELILVSHDPFSLDTPYRSASPIFLHRRSCAPNVDRSEIPAQLERRQLSVRAFDANDMMIDAKVVGGDELRVMLATFFSEESTAFVDIHNASRGCWAARAVRPNT
jgi:Protein of unknown function (DUF1203)